MVLRICCWSGPRNLSTAMMRSFGNRPDTAVVDEPFYAAYLAETGLDHPMRAEVLASQPTDRQKVAAALLGPVPGGRAVFYQKHMTHHMRPGDAATTALLGGAVHLFLIRRPEAVVASYAKKRENPTLEDIGVPQQTALFDEVAQRLGHAPPVIDAADVLADPQAVLHRACAALGLSFDPAMLAWPPGRRDTDGVWAPVWYAAVERSTGFSAPEPAPDLADLPPALARIAEAATPDYVRLWRVRLVG